MEIEKKQQEMNIREMQVSFQASGEEPPLIAYYQLKTKIRQLPKMSRFLLTDSPDWLTTTIATTTVMPISFGPARDKQTAEKCKPLFYVRFLFLAIVLILMISCVTATSQTTAGAG